jgi:hypothetical protein
LKNYVEAMNVVDKAFEIYENVTHKDFIKIAKLLARKAAIYKFLGDYAKSIEFYQKSLLED